MKSILVQTLEQSTWAVMVEELSFRYQNPIIDDDMFLTIMFILLGVISQTIAVFGVVGNVVNIVVFVKQGFTDKVNISLLALSVSDMTSLLLLIWNCLCFTPVMNDPTLPFVALEIQVISGYWSHLIFTRTTGWITAFISLERCLCVIQPFKVKTIITKQRHIVSMLAIFIVTIGCSILAYFNLGLGWKFYPERNATLIGLVFLVDEYQKKVIEFVGYAICGVFMPMTCFLSVLVFTIVLVVKLNQQASWRKLSSHATEDKSLSTRDQRVAKMIVFISVIFIICYLPAVATFVAGYVEPQFTYDGFYKNIFMVTLAISCATDAVNSSINIIIYVLMSTKYREKLLTLIRFIK